jgi:hypothetical protein
VVEDLEVASSFASRFLFQHRQERSVYRHVSGSQRSLTGLLGHHAGAKSFPRLELAMPDEVVHHPR